MKRFCFKFIEDFESSFLFRYAEGFHGKRDAIRELSCSRVALI